MKIDASMTALENRLREPHWYANEGDCSTPERVIGYADAILSAESFLGHRPVVREKDYRVSDIALPGPGNHHSLASEWGLDLPEDYRRFCLCYNGYAFCGASFILIYNAEDARDSVVDLRQGWDIQRDEAHRLYHFAKVIGDPAYFSLRWLEAGGEPDVVFVWDYGDVGEPHLLGKDGDRFVSDASFTAWLARMIETDGKPLFPSGDWPMADGGLFEDEYPYFKRMK